MFKFSFKVEKVTAVSGWVRNKKVQHLLICFCIQTFSKSVFVNLIIKTYIHCVFFSGGIFTKNIQFISVNAIFFWMILLEAF